MKFRNAGAEIARMLNVTRAAVAARIANLKHGGDRRQQQGASLHLDDEPPAPPVTVESAAELLNVSPRSVASARTVLDQGAPELVAASRAALWRGPPPRRKHHGSTSG